MPTSRAPAVFVILAGLYLASCATSPSLDDMIAEVQAAHTKLVAAYNSCNPETFTGAYTLSFTFITSNTRAPITTPDGLRNYLAAGCRQSPSPQVVLTSQSIKVAGHLAIATGQYTFRIAAGGGIADVKQNYTLVMSRTVDGWRIAAHHVSMAP